MKPTTFGKPHICFQMDLKVEKELFKAILRKNYNRIAEAQAIFYVIHAKYSTYITVLCKGFHFLFS